MTPSYLDRRERRLGEFDFRRNAEQRWSLRGTPRPSTTTIHFVPLPRLVFPTPQPLFSREQNSRPKTIRSTSTAGARSTRSETSARCSTTRPAPPSLAAASRSRDAGISPACLASEPRSAESTESLPAHDGFESSDDRPCVVWAAWGARARSSATALRSATHPIGPSALLGRC